MKFSQYDKSHFDACLGLFDENCPNYFAKNEREDYINFLEDMPSNYSVGFIDFKVVSAFGLVVEENSLRGRLAWILVSSKFKGSGLGSEMMKFVISSAREKDLLAIDIAASHLSAPFFAKFNAAVIGNTENAWGEGMHRVDMELKLK